MTPSRSSPSARGVAWLGWSLSGPKTVLIATCIFGVGSTPSKINSPCCSKSSLSSARTSAVSEAVVRHAADACAEREIVADRPHGDRRHGRIADRSSSAQSTSWGTSKGQRTNSDPASATALATLVPLVVAPRRLDELGAGQPRGERLGRGARVRHVGGAAAEHENRHVQAGDVVGVEPGNERVVARAVGQHPSVHHLEELAGDPSTGTAAGSPGCVPAPPATGRARRRHPSRRATRHRPRACSSSWPAGAVPARRR